MSVHHMRRIRPLGSGWHGHGWRRESLSNAPPFIGREKESSILLYRAAKSRSELVLIELRFVTWDTLYGGEAICISVKLRVPEELIGIAVKTVRPGLCYNIDHRTRVAAIFGVEGIGQNAEFLNAVRRWLHGRQVHELIIGVATINTKIVRPPTTSVHRHGPSSVVTIDDRVSGTDGGHYPGLQLQELVSIAGIERQLGHRPIVHNRPSLRAGGVHQRRLRGHLHHFLRPAHLHGHIHGDDLVDQQREVFLNRFFEPRLLVFEAVVAYRHSGKLVMARLVGLRGLNYARLFISELYADPSQHCAGGIAHVALDSATRALGVKQERGYSSKTDHQQPAKGFAGMHATSGTREKSWNFHSTIRLRELQTLL